MIKFDLHTHSIMSDGTDTPAELVRKAALGGLSLVAITDHDTTAGIAEAAEAGCDIGIDVLSGIEIDCQFDGELHVLGLGIDIENSDLLQLERLAKVWRKERNEGILKKLAQHGVDAAPHMETCGGTVTRTHIARAVVKAGGASSIQEVFNKYIGSDASCYVQSIRPDYGSVIDIIHSAGGFAVLAHPCKLKCDVHALVGDMAACGLDGLEVFYPTATRGQVELFSSLAAQYDLLMTCGSDYHGAARNAHLGDACEDNPYLAMLHDVIFEQCF